MTNGRGRPAIWNSLAARLEIETLAIVAVAAGSLLVFAALAAEVLDGDLRSFDERVLLAMRVPGDLSDPVGPRWLEEAVRDLTALGSTSVLTLIVASVAGYLLMTGRRIPAAAVVAATALGAVLSTLSKLGFDRPRPDLVPHGMDVFTPSFPSGHALSSAVVYLTLGALLARTESEPWVKAYVLGLAVVLTLLVGLSRVYLGVHWPTDVLAGWTLGASWAALCWLVVIWLQRRGAWSSGRPTD